MNYCRVVAMMLLACGLAACASSTAAGPMQENAVVHHPTATDLAFVRSREPLTGEGAVLYVQGMGCPQCVTNIEPQLERIKAVKSVDVDLGAGTATLVFKPGVTRPSPDRLYEAVADGGLTLVKVEAK